MPAGLTASADNLLLVSRLPGYGRAARLREGRLESLWLRRDDRPSLHGEVYLGRVLRSDRSLGAAFVDLGLAQPGFLPLDAGAPRPNEGESLIVRVVREAFEDKGPKLSTSLPEALCRRLEPTLAGAKAPALLHRADDPLHSLFASDDPPERVLVDDAASLAEARGSLEAQGMAGTALELYQGRETLFDAFGVTEEIEALLLPEVALPGGGSLLIEPVRSLTAVDVNAGGRRAGDAARLALETNLAAAAAAARQLRLRKLSGLIVVDFLELKPREQRQEVVRSLRRHMKPDPQAGQVTPMSASGLVEVTRRRAGPALHELLTRPCGLGGSGRAWDPAVLAWEALLRLRHQALGRAGRPPKLRVSPALSAALSGPAAAALQAVEAALGQQIVIEPESARADENPEIVLE